MLTVDEQIIYQRSPLDFVAIMTIFNIFYSQVSTHIEVDRALIGEGGDNPMLPGLKPPEPKVQPPAVSTSTLLSTNFRYVIMSIQRKTLDGL